MCPTWVKTLYMYGGGGGVEGGGMSIVSTR